MPAKICYAKIVHCCYKFEHCGVKEHREKVVYKCPYKKRVKKKVRKCRKVRKHVPVYKKVQHCYYSKLHHKRVCKYVTKKTGYKAVWKNKCKYVVVKKWLVVKATCIKYKIYHLAKYCPKLECNKPKYDGEYKEPKAVIADKGKYIKSTEVKRTDDESAHKIAHKNAHH